MSDVTEPDIPRTCPDCGAELQQATLEMDEEKLPRPEYRPGEHVAVAFCPNPDCPSHR
jgi:hypothetical protein